MQIGLKARLCLPKSQSPLHCPFGPSFCLPPSTSSALLPGDCISTNIAIFSLVDILPNKLTFCQNAIITCQSEYTLCQVNLKYSECPNTGRPVWQTGRKYVRISNIRFSDVRFYITSGLNHIKHWNRTSEIRTISSG